MSFKLYIILKNFKSTLNILNLNNKLIVNANEYTYCSNNIKNKDFTNDIINLQNKLTWGVNKLIKDINYKKL